MNRRERRWNAKPVVVSLLLHVAMVGLLAFSARGEAPEPPKTKVYAVDVVSPPPNMAGAPPTEALSNQEPGPAAAPSPAPAAETPPAPAPEPDPPAPDPEPAPPKEAPKEPEKAPEPRRTPPQRPPTQPAQRPSTTNTRPTASNTRPSQPTTTNNRPTTTPEKGRTTPTRPTGSSTTGGTGSGSTRTRGDGTSTAPATGSNPQAGSPGGEGINVHVEGEPCPVAGYCDRVQVTVIRFFRPPPGNAGARGEVCFRILRDGSVADIETRRVRGGGSAAFRLAMMEAAEAAGSRRAFGTLPGAFDPVRWRWCVELTPR